LGEFRGEEDVTGGSGVPAQGASNPGCAVCDAAAGVIVECDAEVILIRHGAGLALAPRRHVARWRELSTTEQAALAVRIGAAQALLETAGTTVRVGARASCMCSRPHRSRSTPRPGCSPSQATAGR